jgi:hypothetical protein
MIYLINRTDRPERRRHAMEQLEAQGQNAHLFPAIVSKIGWHGCRDSHLACIVHAVADGEITTVLEDDVLFLEDIQVAQICMMELPIDWDILYLGGSPQRPQERYSPRLYKANGVLCMHAIVYNPRKGGAVDYILEQDDKHAIGKIDVFLMNEIQPVFNCFLTRPMIATQRQFQSDTCRRSDVSTIEKNYTKYCL